MLFKLQLKTGAGIEAAPEDVWPVLVDFRNYGAWNPFVLDVEGEPVPGGVQRMRLRLPHGRPAGLTMRINRFDPPRLIGWRGRLGVPFLLDVRHEAELEALRGGGTHLVHTTDVRGFLVPLLRGVLRQGEQGLKDMSLALANQVEAEAVSRT
ncbi:MAG: SRPBCC domain-containing protein [Thermoleophilia bacterium]